MESVQRLNVSYQGAQFLQEDVLSDEEAISVLDVYMSVYILGFMHADLSTMTGAMAKELHANILEMYPTWPETQQFLREVHASVAPKNFMPTSSRCIQHGQRPNSSCERYMQVLLQRTSCQHPRDVSNMARDP